MKYGQAFKSDKVKIAKSEYQQLRNYADRLRAMSEGRVISRSEVFELQLAVIAVELLEICKQCSNQHMEGYLKQCLWRSLSFEDFMAVVYSHGWRRSA
jgi:hypothetical protein